MRKDDEDTDDDDAVAKDAFEVAIHSGLPKKSKETSGSDGDVASGSGDIELCDKAVELDNNDDEPDDVHSTTSAADHRSFRKMLKCMVFSDDEGNEKTAEQSGWRTKWTKAELTLLRNELWSLE